MKIQRFEWTEALQRFKYFFYTRYQAVIPAKAGIQVRNPGFRVKPGMTNKVKGLLTQYNRMLEDMYAHVCLVISGHGKRSTCHVVLTGQ